VFGGPAWTQVADGQWYLHLFDESQPDVNWEDPDVPAEFDSVMRFWLDRGAAGFRIDVAHAPVKAPGYPDAGAAFNDGKGRIDPVPYFDRDEIHPIVGRWRRLLDEYGDRMMVAEAWVDAERRPLYLRPDEYHQAFDFDLLSAPGGAGGFRTLIAESVRAAQAVGSDPTWVLSIHDVVRHATRYGLPGDVEPGLWLLDGPHEVLDVDRGARRARAAAMVTLALPGSAYVYQGDELGLPEAWNLPSEVLADPIRHDSGHTIKGRDGCLAPVPWEPTGPSLGFGTGVGWLPQPDEYAALSASARDSEPDSTLNLYRATLSCWRRGRCWTGRSQRTQRSG
jgi:alpha-glucosidase